MPVHPLHTLRERLHLTQDELGRILGVNAMTVSRWERREYDVPQYQSGLIKMLERAASHDPKLGAKLSESLIGAGSYEALRLVLNAALASKAQKDPT